MTDAPATVAPGADNPQPPVERRTCRACDQTKQVSPETWPYRKKRKSSPYKAHGQICRDCINKRRADYEKRRGEIATSTIDVPADPIRGQSSATADAKAQQKAAVVQSKLDIAAALKAGSRVLNDIAPGVLARIVSWAEDDEHEDHRWAVQFLAERIVPRKLYEELGADAAGRGGLGDKRPQFIIQVLPAQPTLPEGRVLEGEVETVQLLPSPAPTEKTT